MSCLICNELLHHHLCELCNIFEPFPPPWHMLLTHMYLWTNHLCISCKHISPPKVVTQLPKPNKDLSIFPFLVIDDNSTKIWKLSSFQASTSHKCKLPTWFGFYATYPTFKLYVKIWIIIIKPDLVVIAPPTCVLKWFDFKFAYMHKYEICGSVITTKWC